MRPPLWVRLRGMPANTVSASPSARAPASPEQRHPHHAVVVGGAVVRVEPRARRPSSDQTARPCRPDSPPETTPGTTPTCADVPSAVSSRTVPSSRSDDQRATLGQGNDRPGRREAGREGRRLRRPGATSRRTTLGDAARGGRLLVRDADGDGVVRRGAVCTRCSQDVSRDERPEDRSCARRLTIRRRRLRSRRCRSSSC